MPDRTILIVDDEQAVRDMIAFGLRRAGFAIDEAGDCAAARLRLVETPPDLILMDWMLPDMSGLEFTRALKKGEDTADIPVIMLTARGAEDDRIRGLNGGADDYVTKPFSTRELVARIHAVLRRAAPEAVDTVLCADRLSLDLASHRVSVGDDAVRLGPTEFKLLRFFMTHPDRVFSREQLLDRVWGRNVYIEERTVDVHIRRLRKALADFGYDRFVQTVRGAGYRFSAN